MARHFTNDECRAAELPELGDRHICADYLEGLIRVVPRHGAGDNAGKYCIGGFAIDLYATLLQERDVKFRRWCWGSVFLPRHDKVSAQRFAVVCGARVGHMDMSIA